MTRELKFRAWDKLSGRYYLDVLLEEGGAIKATEREGQPSWPRDFVWEQFTGLTDKNGRRIYEGDIVRSGNFIAAVAWENDGWNQFNDFGHGAMFDRSDCEVIGNVHQDPNK